MAKGAIAKQEVINRIAAAFGADYVGEYDKKIYVNAMENGEKIQIALSLTCPKVPITLDATVQIGDFNFEEPTSTTTVAQTSFTPAEYTDEERDNVAALMARLGL